MGAICALGNTVENWGFGGARSDFIVVVAIAIYCLLVGVILGDMATSGACRFNVWSCAPGWIKDYQALIASFSVVFTVIVAKQQLDANRNQHVLTIKRSFKKEVESIDYIAYFSRGLTTRSFEDYTCDKDDYTILFRSSIPSKKEVIELTEDAPKLIASFFELLVDSVRDLESSLRHHNDGEQNNKNEYIRIKRIAAHILGRANQEMENMSKYWAS